MFGLSRLNLAALGPKHATGLIGEALAANMIRNAFQKENTATYDSLSSPPGQVGSSVMQQGDQNEIHKTICKRRLNPTLLLMASAAM